MHLAESWMLASWLVNPPVEGDRQGMGVGGGAGPVKAQGDKTQMWSHMVLHA